MKRQIDFDTVDLKFNTWARGSEFCLFSPCYIHAKNKLVIIINTDHPFYTRVAAEKDPNAKKALEDCMVIFASSCAIAKLQGGKVLENISRSLGVFMRPAA